MSTPDKAGKTMSSRLLTMKFMQRAAAAFPTTSPATPTDRPSKKQRLSNGSSVATPSSDARALQEALAAEDLKKQQALDRQAADAGETKWVLSYQDSKPKTTESPIQIVTAGYAAIDDFSQGARRAAQTSSTAVRPEARGRRSFGKFNRAVERLENPDLSSSESSDTSSDSDSEAESDSEDASDDDPDSNSRLINEARKEAAKKERKAKRKAEKAEAARLASQRRSKEVKLNSSGGISNGGGSMSRNSNKTCFECGKPGHERRDCPSKRKR